MRLFRVFTKTLREQRRDVLALAATVAFAPFFVVLYWMFFPSGSTTYGVLVLDQDSPAMLADSSTLDASSQLTAVLRDIKYPNGGPMLKVQTVTDRADAEARLRDREASLMLVIPPGFSAAVAGESGDGASGAAQVAVVGDLANPTYAVTVTVVAEGLRGYVDAATGAGSPVQIVEQPLGGSSGRTEFENYVPGLLVFAVIMLVFLAAMAVAREVESGTLRRLQITRMTSFDFLGGVSLAIVVVGVVAVILTFATAVALGFHSQGPLWVAVLVGAITALGVIGTGLMVACFCKNVTQAYLIGSFPMGLFMFFSGAVFPIPKVKLFELAGHTIGLYDVLPPTYAVVALNKVLTLGAGLSDVTYELTGLLILSVLYLAIGVWLFGRRQLRAH